MANVDPRKPLLFSQEEILEWSNCHPTPFYVYDERTIVASCRGLKEAFKWCSGFTNYFAVKATPNPYILNIIRNEGLGVDCSSLAELILAECCHFKGDRIMFTSNNTPAKEYEKAVSLGAIVNLDDISQIDFLGDCVSLPNMISFRFNPGEERVGNSIIGNPAEAKFGLTREQIFEALSICHKRGVQIFGLHTMVVSNCLEFSELVSTAEMMFKLAAEAKSKLGISVSLINLGGGIGIPYRPEDTAIDFQELGKSVKTLFDTHLAQNGLGNVRLAYENGRCITGPAGCLVTRVINQKNTYKNYIGVDACMANLMRPSLYGAYHHISTIKDDPKCAMKLPRNSFIFTDAAAEKYGKDNNVYDVVGSLCENNDKLAVDRKLGKVQIGDILVIHDTGAHGHAMGFNYNGKLRSSEYLKKADGKLVQIRRAETYEDLFATIDYCSLPGSRCRKMQVCALAALGAWILFREVLSPLVKNCLQHRT